MGRLGLKKRDEYWKSVLQNLDRARLRKIDKEKLRKKVEKEKLKTKVEKEKLRKKSLDRSGLKKSDEKWKRVLQIIIIVSGVITF